MRTKELFKFIHERYRIFEKKEAGLPKPWTKDPILQQYSFCNVHRENDRVTRWIAENWRAPNADNPDLWFAMCVARKVNWPDSLAAIGYPSPWNPKKFLKALELRAAAGEQLESGAYMITAGTGPKWEGVSKREFLAEAVFTPLWKARKALRPTPRDTLRSFHGRLEAAGNTFGSFLAAQIVADVKYTAPLSEAVDWWTFAASGPGSRRGLNRVLERDKDSPWKEEDWHDVLLQLKAKIDPLVAKAGIPPLHAQDLQNVTCEWDKYERTRLGEGRPRSKYPGV